MFLTCDDVELQDIANFGSKEKCLATNAGVRESATDAEVKVICPRTGCQSFLQGLPQDVNPQLPACGIHEGLLKPWLSMWSNLDALH